MQPARVRAEDLAEPFSADPERFGAQVGQLCLGLLRGQQPDPRALLRAGLGQDQLPAADEPQPEGRRLRALLSRPEVAQAPGGHQVDEQDELAVLRREEEALGAPLGTG